VTSFFSTYVAASAGSARLGAFLADGDGVDDRELLVDRGAGRESLADRARLTGVLDQQGERRARGVVEAQVGEESDVEQPRVDDAGGDQRDGVDRHDGLLVAEGKFVEEHAGPAGTGPDLRADGAVLGPAGDHLVAGDESDGGRLGALGRDAAGRLVAGCGDGPSSAGHEGDGEGRDQQPGAEAGQDSPLRWAIGNSRLPIGGRYLRRVGSRRGRPPARAGRFQLRPDRPELLIEV
jgi:hypothetical protein